jgi:predicted RND superfamily exporter protein
MISLRTESSIAALVVVAALTLIPASQLSHLTVDTSNEAMSAAEAQAGDVFESRPTLLIVVSSDLPITPVQWQTLHRLTAAVGKVPGVDSAVLPLLQADGWTVRLFRKVHPGGATRLQNLLRLLRSEDDRTLGLLVMLSPEAAMGAQRTQTLADLRAVLDAHQEAGLRTSLVGLPVVNEAVGELVRRDQSLLLPLSAGVIFGMLLLIYRRPTGVLLPLVVIGLAVVWTLGIYAWHVQQLNVVTSLLAPVVMILSLATAVHVYEAFLACQEPTRSAAEIVRSAVGRVWRPCLFSTLTTAAGLASLTCSSLPAVRLFGLYGALGVTLACLFGLTVMPWLLLFCVTPRSARAPAGVTWVPRLLTASTHLGWDRSKVVWTALFGLSCLALVGVSRLHSNTDLMAYLRQDSDLVRTSRFVDQHLIGINTLTCRITPQTASAFDSNAYDDFLAAAAGIDGINGVLPEASNGALESDGDTWNCTLRVRSIGSRRARVLLATLTDLVRQHFGPQAEVHFGGYFHRIVTESDQLVRDLVRSFALALTIITLLIGLQFRSWRATWMSLVPNLLSVFWIFGAMGLAGIDLSTGTAMIACVVIGLAVDHTIHYLSFLHRTSQPHLRQAILDTNQQVGPALVISTLILAAGFGVGMAGSFKPTIYFSLFTALAMLAALFCNLTVIPMLIRMAALRGKRTEPIAAEVNPRAHREEVHAL